MSDLSRSYNPFGVLMPLTVTGKLLMQQLWLLRLGWDDEVPKDFLVKWHSFIGDLSCVQIVLDRKLGNFCTPNLHIYADASPKCYGVVAYLVENNFVQFLVAKSRVAPTKAPSLAQLELTAVNIGARLGKYIKITYAKYIAIKTIVLFTDSLNVVAWLKSTVVSNKPYVRQRVSNIRDLLPEANIAHVPGNQNPADYLTRGQSTKEFMRHSPSYLNPEYSLTCENSEKEILTVTNTVVATPIKLAEIEVFHEPVIDVKNYSSFPKAVRVTSYVLKFIAKLKRSILKTSNEIVPSNLSVKDLKSAETALIKIYQYSYFTDIVEFFRSNGKIKIAPNLVHQLNLVLVDDIIKVKTRLQHSNVDERSVWPVLLPRHCPLTALIIRNAHTHLLHSGVNAVLCHLRERWWVPAGRQAVRAVLRKCVPCKKVIGKPYTSPRDPPLPSERVLGARPFQFTGLDYSGAIEVKDKKSIIKAYIALFTCLITRAIHLELAESLSTEDFLRVLTKFSSRRSYPQLLYSDNASSFHAASETLKVFAESGKVGSYLMNNNIQWKFITPRAPWQGGAWERMIGLTKTCMKKVIGKALLTRQELDVLLTQIECVLNDRPITYVSNDLNYVYPLTPAHLMYGFKLREFPNFVPTDVMLDPSYNDRLKVSDFYVQRIEVLKQFNSRWEKEYLTSLRERFSVKNGSCPIKAGQIVLIADNRPRVYWKMGVVTRLIRGTDKCTRIAELKTSAGKMLRSIKQLYPLEVDCVTDCFAKEFNMNV